MHDLTAIVDSQRFANAPSDWFVAMTDIRGSSKAIEEGRYREINLVGAASVVALLNLDRSLDLPFVFGGDGVTFLIPPKMFVSASEALAATRTMAQRAFGIELRIGLIPIADLAAAGHSFRVAKITLSGDFAQAIFSGSGVAYAEKLIKDPTLATPYLIPETTADTETVATLEGLECRWQAIPSRHDETVSLMVQATTDNERHDVQVYYETLTAIKRVYGNDADYRPIDVAMLKPSADPLRLAGEARVRRSNSPSQLWYTIKIWFLNLAFRWFMIKQEYWQQYLALLSNTIDYRKYDGTLRLVISGTAQQREELLRYLDQRQQAGDLVFGLQVAEETLLTCIVMERLGRQIHFVDGTNGGLTLAAYQLKQRLRERQTLVEGEVPAPVNDRPEARRVDLLRQRWLRRRAIGG